MTKNQFLRTLNVRLLNSRNETGTSLINSIVSGNSGPGGTTGTDVEFASSTNSFTSGGYNLIGSGNAIARFSQAGDQTSINDPRLEPLQDNGGPTLTRALLDGSPAINGGDPSVAFDRNSFDQRGPGFFRVRAGRIDIGAFELEIGEVPIPAINAVDDNYTLTFGNAGQTQQAGVTLLSTGVFLINARGVLANDSDPSGGALTAALASYPKHGRIQVRGDGSVY